MFQERYYQHEARVALYEAWRSGEAKNPLIEIGTAGGKSVIIAKLMQECIDAYPATRIGMVTHVKELVHQNHARLMALWPDAPAGIYSAGLGKKELHEQITFAGIQSIFKRAYDIQGWDILLIDEAHLVPHAGEGQYRQFIDEMLTINPHMRIVGFTASPFRLSSGMLTEPFKGTPPLFDKVVYSFPYVKLLEGGFVSPLIAKGSLTKIDLSGVGHRGGEFIQTELAEAMDTDPLNKKVVEEIVETGRERSAWLVFGVTKAHAYKLRDLIRTYGFSCETVTSDTTKEERARILREFSEGKIRCLTNVDILTTGTDIPIVDLIALVRATESPGLLLQMVGRGVRLHEGKANCVVLDFGTNFVRLGPIDQLSVRRADAASGRKKVEQLPAKCCPKCQDIVPIALMTCACGFEWEMDRDRLANVKDTASDAPILSIASKPEWHDVSAVHYYRQPPKDPSRPDMLKVVYSLGFGMSVSELVLIEHVGGARARAEDWWQKRDRTGSGCPETVTAALHLADDLRTPGRVMIVRNGKYYDVLAHDFAVQPAGFVVGGEEIQF